MQSELPEDWRNEFTVYPFTNSYEIFLQIPESLLLTANDMILVTIALTALLFCIVTIVLIRENGREIGTYLSLGISDWDIVMKTAGENTILVVFSLFAAACFSVPVHRFLSKGYNERGKVRADRRRHRLRGLRNGGLFRRDSASDYLLHPYQFADPADPP